MSLLIHVLNNCNNNNNNNMITRWLITLIHPFQKAQVTVISQKNDESSNNTSFKLF